MASYTMELRNYIEMFSQYENLSTRDTIEKGRTKLFDFPYPIFDPDYKKIFETNFIRKFYMREIGFETEGLFKFQLETWLLINMPYYNKLLESELKEFDPFINEKIDVTHNKTNEIDQTDTRTGTQNKVNELDQTDTRILTQNKVNEHDQTDTRILTQNKVNDLTNHQKTDQTSVTDGTSNTVNDGTSIVTGSDTKDTTQTKTDDNFNRQLSSDTPDGRLNLTTNDGEGVIEYASKIEENNENNSENTTTNIDGTHTSTTNDDLTSDTTTHVNSTDGVISDGTSNMVEDITNNDNLVKDISQTEDITSNDNLVKDISQIEDITSNDNLVKDINQIEDYVQHRIGKVGTQTYSKMLEEYRSTFLRIEKQIFEEMQELFMGVY